MPRIRTVTPFVLALLVALPLAAAEPGDSPASAPAAKASAQGPSACIASSLSLPLNLAREGGPLPDAGSQSDCTAQCVSGSVTCDQGTSFTAVDASCPGQDGYCWDNVGGYQFCDPGCEDPPCPGPTCEEVDGTFCKFTGATCYVGVNCSQAQCFCNNNVNICP